MLPNTALPDPLTGPGISTSTEACGPPIRAVSIRTVVAGTNDSRRKHLLNLLEGEPGIHIAGDCGETDVSFLRRFYDPDLLLLDLQNHTAHTSRYGYESPEDCRPVVVVISESESGAHQAFELNAVDFMLIPFGQERIRRALDKVRAELLRVQLSRLARHVANSTRPSQPPRQPERLAVKNDGRIVFVPMADIEWISASANYVQIHTAQETYVMRESIGKLSQRLDSARFLRVHRSIIVNGRKLKELLPCNSGEYIAILRSGKKLSCSRGFRNSLDNFIAACWH